MNLSWRLRLVAICLSVFVLAEGGLRRHLNQGGEHAYPEMRTALAGFPLELSQSSVGGAPIVVWRGQEQPGLDAWKKKLPYQADDLLWRHYQSPGAASSVQLYMVYSKIGDDRKHHPEICIRDVAGAPEDLLARKTVALDAERQRQAASFRFQTSATALTTVYYWHYTFPPLPQEGRDALQTLHLQLRQPSPSITVQVSTSAHPAELESVERSFLPAVDSAMRATHLPPSALIGCDRLPIGLTRE